MRSCLGCHAQIAQTERRCARCQSAWHREREARRGNRLERGYGAAHQAAKRALAFELPGFCGGGCGRVIGVAANDWVAAHVVDGDESAGWVATCRSCNERMKRSRRNVRQRVGS